MVKFCPKCGEKISENTIFCPECGVDVNTFTVNDRSEEVEESEFHFWSLSPITLLYVGLLTAFLIYSVIITPSGIFFFLYSVIMGYWCGSYIVKKYAPKVNVSQSWAFAIGYTFVLIGLFCFWLYYLYKRDKTPSQKPPVKEKVAGKTILKIIAIVFGILLLLVIVSIAVISSGSITSQKQVVTQDRISPSFLTYENQEMRFKISYPSSWQITDYFKDYSHFQIRFVSPDAQSQISVKIVDLPSQYLLTSLDATTESMFSGLQIINNENSILSDYGAKEIVYIDPQTNHKGIARFIIVDQNLVYIEGFSKNQESFDSALPVFQTAFNSFSIQTQKSSTVQTFSTSTYLQGSESNNPYAANAIYAQRILRCQQGMEDWDYCAQQCRLANQIGYKCNEQSLKQMWDANH